jgi:hypothetical protein
MKFLWNFFDVKEFNSEQIFDEPEALNALTSSDYFGIANIRTFEDPKNLVSLSATIALTVIVDSR